MNRRFTRRTLLVAGGALLAGCTADPSGPGAESTTRSEPPRSPQTSRTPPPDPPVRLPAAQPWQPGPGEIEPSVKVAAARVVEALGTATAGAPQPARRLALVGADPALADSAGPLVAPVSPSVTSLVYPQYGGLTDDAASVMVVAEQIWPAADGGGLTRRTVTVDVRLARTQAAWVVTGLRPAPAGRPTTAELTGTAATLAANPRLDLPDAAVLDLAGGLVDSAVVDGLLLLAQDFRLAVSVFRAGHPETVFGETVISNHTRGRAVDVWAVDGVPVADMALDSPLLRRFLLAAARTGSNEIGGPVVPNLSRNYFKNDLHRDHVHIGFDRRRD